jgi:hypothetical protein
MTDRALNEELVRRFTRWLFALNYSVYCEFQGKFPDLAKSHKCRIWCRLRGNMRCNHPLELD